MIKIDLVGDTELSAFFESFPEELQSAVYDKLVWVTNIMHKIVIDNVSGRLLQTKTGALARSIQQTVSRDGDKIVGFVGPVPANAKAWALEYGGNKSYEIVPSKGRVLHFIGKGGESVFTTKVNHPPAVARRYLRQALEEMPYIVYSAFLGAIDQVLAK